MSAPTVPHTEPPIADRVGRGAHGDRRGRGAITERTHLRPGATGGRRRNRR